VALQLSIIDAPTDRTFLKRAKGARVSRWTTALATGNYASPGFAFTEILFSVMNPGIGLHHDRRDVPGRINNASTGEETTAAGRTWRGGLSPN